MRRPTLSRWTKRLILSIAKTDEFSLRKLAAAAQDSAPRLAEPLLIYAYSCGNADKLLQLIWDKELLGSYKLALQAFGGNNLADIALGNPLGNPLGSHKLAGIPREYAKILRSYKAAYHRPETESMSKRMRWERSRLLQLQKGVSAAEIYHALDLNPGNVNAYLKHGRLEKVSLEKATDIMKFLYEL